MESQPFGLLAGVYDAIMSDVEYAEWADFILDLALNAGAEVRSVLDLGCGTGNSLLPFAEMGLAVAGIDASAQMLAVARRKLPEASLTQADFTAFSLAERFDLVTSVFDSLNNLLEPEAFLQTSRRVLTHLKPGGAFIFDVNTTAGLRNLWEDGRTEGWVDDVYYRWEHSFDERRGLAKVVAYCERGAQRFTEVHYERPYDPAELRVLLERAGFVRVRVVTFPDALPPSEGEGRVWVVAQRSLARALQERR